MAAATPTSVENITTERHPLALFFDGECCFCNRWVGRLMRADADRRTRFGAKQGRTFQRIAENRPDVANVESIVLFRREPSGRENVLVRSAAVRAAIEGLPGYGFFSAVLNVVPTPIADLGYRIFSKLRKFIFGAQNICHVVQPEERELFLD